jgi:hypothetical protein
MDKVGNRNQCIVFDDLASRGMEVTSDYSQTVAPTQTTPKLKPLRLRQRPNQLNWFSQNLNLRELLANSDRRPYFAEIKKNEWKSGD